MWSLIGAGGSLRRVPFGQPDPHHAMRAILTYHAIDDSGSPISVTPQLFEAHLRWFTSGAVPVIPLTELVRQRSDAPAVAITFDDALESAATWALPRLAASGIPATMFVATQHVGRDNRWGGVAPRGIPVLPVMSWEALGRWAEQGLAIGAHSRTHPRLPDCPPEVQRDEIVGSGEEIARELGIRPDCFAYPYGATNAAVRAMAAQHYRLSVTTILRPLSTDDDTHDLPRLDAWYFRDTRWLERWGAPSLRGWLALRRFGRSARRVLP